MSISTSDPLPNNPVSTMDSTGEAVKPLVTEANHEQQHHNHNDGINFTPFSALKQATVEILTGVETAANAILNQKTTVTGKPVFLELVDEYLDCSLRTVDMLSDLQKQLLTAGTIRTVVDEALACTGGEDLRVPADLGRFSEAAAAAAASVNPLLPQFAGLVDDICRQQQAVHCKLIIRTMEVSTRLKFLAGAERMVKFVSDITIRIDGAANLKSSLQKCFGGVAAAGGLATVVESSLLPWFGAVALAVTFLGPFVGDMYKSSKDSHHRELGLLREALTADPKDPTCALDAMKKLAATIESSAKRVDHPGRATLDQEEAQRLIRDVMQRLKEELKEYEDFAGDLQSRCANVEGLIRRVKSGIHEPEPQEKAGE